MKGRERLRARVGEEGKEKGKKEGRKKEGRRRGRDGKEGKEGKEKEKEGKGRKKRKTGKGMGKARQEEWTLPMASRSLHQMPMEGRAALALAREGLRGARWGQPAWSASASSRRLWQRSKIPGPLGP